MQLAQQSFATAQPVFEATQSAKIIPFARGATSDQAGIVHDLGNLIQVVTSALNIISRDADTRASQKLNPVIATAKSSLERAGVLIRQSLAAARGQVILQELVDLGSCVRDLVPTSTALCGPAILIDFQEANSPLSVMCNRVDFENAVLNLVINARDAMPDGGRLSISASDRWDGVSDRIEIRVADTGRGMSPEILAHALDPFFTTKGDRGGSGVGLAMVARFVADAEGSIDISSTLGSGASIRLSFPKATVGSAFSKG